MLIALLTMLLLDDDEDEEPEPQLRSKRSKLIRRERRPWSTYVQPLLDDKNTFRNRFHVGHEDFTVLAEVLRPALAKDEKMGALRNGAVPVEY